MKKALKYLLSLSIVAILFSCGHKPVGDVVSESRYLISETDSVFFNRKSDEKGSRFYFTVRDTIQGIHYEFDKDNRMLNKRLYQNGETVFQKIFHWSGNHLDSCGFYTVGAENGRTVMRRQMVWTADKHEEWFWVAFNPISCENLNDYFFYPQNVDRVEVVAGELTERQDGEGSATVNTNKFFLRGDFPEHGFSWLDFSIRLMTLSDRGEIYDYYHIKTVPIMLPVIRADCSKSKFKSPYRAVF